jgi:hypothetical protein
MSETKSENKTEIVRVYKNVKIQSSNIKTMDYDPEENLIIEFSNGTRYKYKKVPLTIVEGFLKADSKGHFFALFIKGKYEFEKLADKKPEPPIAK